MEKILKYLEQLDLSEIEAKLYLTLLQTGPNSVRDIANAIGIKRTTAYLYVDQLEEKGLIIKTVHKSHPQIEAIPPESSLEHLVKEKVKNTQTIQGDFPNILQSIHAAYPSFENTGDSEIKYYKGKAGVRKIYEEALQAKELRSYVNIAEIAEVFSENAELFANALKTNPSLRIQEIMEDSPASREQTTLFTQIVKKETGQEEKYSYKFIPNDVKIPSADILIYDNKVSVITVRDTVNGVVLYNVDYYNLSKVFFDFIWKILPSTNSL